MRRLWRDVRDGPPTREEHVKKGLKKLETYKPEVIKVT